MTIPSKPVWLKVKEREVPEQNQNHIAESKGRTSYVPYNSAADFVLPKLVYNLTYNKEVELYSQKYAFWNQTPGVQIPAHFLAA